MNYRDSENEPIRSLYECAEPLISILIPCYNATSVILETVYCALDQTWPALEIIVVDDGSTDDTLKQLIAVTDPRLKTLARDNRGAAAARNAAFAASNGRFVLYLDCDDLIDPNHVAALYATLVDHENDVAVSQWDRFYNSKSEARFPARITSRSLGGVEWTFLDWAHVSMTQCGMFLIPRSMIERLGGWDENLSAGPNDDFEFFARVLSKAAMVRYSQEARLYYRSGLAGNLSSNRRPLRAAEAQLESLIKGIGHVAMLIDEPDRRRICANLFQSFDFEHFPRHRTLRRKALRLAREYGGSNATPSGPPGFQRVSRVIGWRAARLLQIGAERLSLNRAARRGTRRSAA